MDAVFYWEMTHGEIMAAIEGNQRRLKADMQIQAMFTYRLGELIGVAINDPKKYPANVNKAFPSLFESIEAPSKQQDWQIMKERMKKYNTYLKMKRGENV